MLFFNNTYIVKNFILALLTLFNVLISIIKLLNFFLEMEIALLLIELDEDLVIDEFKQILFIYYENKETGSIVMKEVKHY